MTSHSAETLTHIVASTEETLAELAEMSGMSAEDVAAMALSEGESYLEEAAAAAV